MPFVKRQEVWTRRHKPNEPADHGKDESIAREAKRVAADEKYAAIGRN